MWPLRIKKFERKILISATANTQYIMLKPLCKHLMEDKRLGMFFTGMFRSKDRPWELYRKFGIPKNLVIREKHAKLKDFDMLLSSDFHMVGQRQKTKVQMFHGIAFRNCEISPLVLNYDAIFLLGEYMKRKLIETGIYAPQDNRFKMIGMPVLDRLKNGSLDKRQIAEKLGLDAKRPIVLYAPTWTQFSSIYRMGEVIFDTLGRMDVNFLIKLHDNLLEPKLNFGINWARVIHKYCGKFHNLIFITDLDIIPYLYVSDCLITDASTVAFQFAILDRPIIFADFDIEGGRKIWGRMDLDTWGRKAGILVKNADELKEAVKNSFKNPNEKSGIRRSMAEDMFYDPGRATQRAVEEIYKLLNIENP